MSKVSVIIPTIKGREEMLARLVNGFPIDYDIVIVDGDMSLSQKRHIGAMRSRGDYLLFIDDDNYIERGAVYTLLKIFTSKDVGIAGMMACYQDQKNRIADGGSKRDMMTGFTKGINTNKYVCDIDYYPYEVDEVANAFMISRKLYMDLGGLDVKRFPTELDEADLCFRAKRLGYKVMMCPLATCYHNSITYSRIPDFRRPKNAYFMGRNRVLFQKKHLNEDWYELYWMVFLPIFVVSYSLCLLYRRKPGYIKHFFKGVCDGLKGRLKLGEIGM